MNGPKAYMDERRIALLDSILVGEDELYDPGGWLDEEQAVLGRLDEDFLLCLAAGS